MGLARVSGHPDYSASGASKFIPEIWSGKLLVKFYDATVLPQISNTDYEGEIKNQGDKVYIRTRGSVTIKKYFKGMKIDYERIESPAIEMVIDQGNYWYYGIDDVDKYQSDIELMDQWAEDATEQERSSSIPRSWPQSRPRWQPPIKGQLPVGSARPTTWAFRERRSS